MPRRITTFAVCSLVLLLVSFFFAGCSNKNSAKYEEPVTNQFSCDFTAYYNEMDVKGKIERSNAGTLKLTLTEPKTVEGLTLEWINEDLKVSMKGLSFKLDPKKIPESALGSAVLSALDSFAAMNEDAKTTFKVGEKGTIVNGTTSAGDFEMVCDPETGYIQSIDIPSLPLEATFTNVQVENIEVLVPPVVVAGAQTENVEN